jgi:hypothetical protein
MGIVYRIDAANALLHSTATGRISTLDMCLHMSQIAEEGAQLKQLNTLMDLKRAVLDVSINDIWDLVRHAIPVARAMGQSRWAIVTDQTHLHAPFHVFEGLMMPRGIQTRVFCDEDKATTWAMGTPATATQNA